MTVHVRYLQFTFERTWLNEEVISCLHTKNYEDLSLAVALQERAEDWQVHCDSSGRQITSTWLSSNRAHSIKTVHTLEKKHINFLYQQNQYYGLIWSPILSLVQLLRSRRFAWVFLITWLAKFDRNCFSGCQICLTGLFVVIIFTDIVYLN